MKTTTIDYWAWRLIFGGIVGVSLGIIFARHDLVVGIPLAVLSAIAIVAGIVLVVVRSRMVGPDDEPPRQPQQPRVRPRPPAPPSPPRQP